MGDEMNEPITENFSKKRGRKASPMSEVIAGLFPEVGKRSQNNKGWMAHAQHALGFELGKPAPAGLEWILSTHSNGEWKRSALLSELGRLDSPELIRSVAAHICQQKPKVKDGVVMVRGYRQSLQGKQPAAADALKLANEIIQSINSYMTRYPEVTDDQIIQALQTATAQIGTR